jgi:putative spermidine/putrescine transport system permease protein
VAFSIPAALAIARHQFPGREVMTALFLSPLMVPHIVLGIAFLRFFTQIGLGGTFTGLVLSHVVIIIPFALRLILASSTGMDRSIENAAASLGASSFTTFRRVTLPLFLPGVASGWVLAFINSFDEVTMTVFIASPETTTLPVRLFLYIQDNIDPLVAAVSAALIFMTVAAMLVLDRLYGLERLLVGRGQE